MSKAEGIDLTKPLHVIIRMEPYKLTLNDPFMSMGVYMLIKTGGDRCIWQQVIDAEEL